MSTLSSSSTEVTHTLHQISPSLTETKTQAKTHETASQPSQPPSKRKKDTQSELLSTSIHDHKELRTSSPPKAIHRKRKQSFNQSSSSFSAPLPDDSPSDTNPNILVSSSSQNQTTPNIATAESNSNSNTSSDLAAKRRSTSKKRRSIRDITNSMLIDNTDDKLREQSPIRTFLVSPNSSQIDPSGSNMPTNQGPIHSTSHLNHKEQNIASIGSENEDSEIPTKFKKSFSSSSFTSSIVSLITSPVKKKPRKVEESDSEAGLKEASKEIKEAKDKDSKEKNEKIDRNDKNDKNDKIEKNDKADRNDKNEKVLKIDSKEELGPNPTKPAQNVIQLEQIASSSSSIPKKALKKNKKKVASKKKKVCFLQNLPVEILLKILCYLEIPNLVAMNMTSKYLLEICKEPVVWHFVALKAMRPGQRKPRTLEWKTYCKYIHSFRTGQYLTFEDKIGSKTFQNYPFLSAQQNLISASQTTSTQSELSLQNTESTSDLNQEPKFIDSSQITNLNIENVSPPSNITSILPTSSNQHDINNNEINDSLAIASTKKDIEILERSNQTFAIHDSINNSLLTKNTSKTLPNSTSPSTTTSVSADSIAITSKRLQSLDLPSNTLSYSQSILKPTPIIKSASAGQISSAQTKETSNNSQTFPSSSSVQTIPTKINMTSKTDLKLIQTKDKNATDPEVALETVQISNQTKQAENHSNSKNSSSHHSLSETNQNQRHQTSSWSEFLETRYPFIFEPQNGLFIRFHPNLTSIFKSKSTLSSSSSSNIVIRAVHVPTREMVSISKIPYLTGMRPCLASNTPDSKETILKLFKKGTSHYLVGFYGNYFDGNYIWVINEFCTGGSCRQQLDAGYGAFSESEISFIARDVLKGLSELHTNGIIHGKISASTFMLSEVRQGRSVVKLREKSITSCFISSLNRVKHQNDTSTHISSYSDKPSSSEDQSGVAIQIHGSSSVQLGTTLPETSNSALSSSNHIKSPSNNQNCIDNNSNFDNDRKVYWRAPELNLTTKSDIWSFGITMLELAEGRPPGYNLQPQRARNSILNGPPPAFKHPTQWSPKFRSFLDICLVKDPSKRPTAEQLLNHPFIKDIPNLKQKAASYLSSNNANRSSRQRVKLSRFNSSPITPTSSISRSSSSIKPLESNNQLKNATQSSQTSTISQTRRSRKTATTTSTSSLTASTSSLDTLSSSLSFNSAKSSISGAANPASSVVVATSSNPASEHSMHLLSGSSQLISPIGSSGISRRPKKGSKTRNSNTENLTSNRVNRQTNNSSEKNSVREEKSTVRANRRVPATDGRGAAAAGSARPSKQTRRLSYAGSASTSDTLTHPYSDSEDGLSFALTHSSSRMSFDSFSEDWASGSFDLSIDSRH